MQLDLFAWQSPKKEPCRWLQELLSYLGPAPDGTMGTIVSVEVDGMKASITWKGSRWAVERGGDMVTMDALDEGVRWPHRVYGGVVFAEAA